MGPVVNVQQLTSGTVLSGRYRIDGVLGQGGMGIVYRGHQLRLERKVAIKALMLPNVEAGSSTYQAHLRQFENEAQILANLDHPALVQVIDFFDQDNVPYLVMEFVEGRTLSAVADLAPKPLSERRVLQWANELFDILEYLHGQNPPIILKDLKPDNVMLEGSGRLKVIDFGIAKRLTASGGTMDISKGVGTEEYAPLEQYGQGSTDQRSDLYSLGATLYYLLTKQKPQPAWQRATKQEPLPDPRQFNPTVSNSTAFALAKLTELFAQHRPASVSAARTLFISGPATSYSLSQQQVQEAKTKVDAVSLGRSRKLQIQLDSRRDFSPIHRAAWLWSTDELLVCRPQRHEVAIYPQGASAPKQVLRVGQPILALAGSPEKPYFAYSCSDGQIFVAEAGHGKVLQTLNKPTLFGSEKIRMLSFAKSRTLLFALSETHQLVAADLQSVGTWKEYRPDKSWFSSIGLKIRCFDVGPSSWLAAGASDGSIFQWEIATGKKTGELKLASSVVDCRFSADGHFLAACCQDGDFGLFAAETGQRLAGSNCNVSLHSLSVSSDARVLALADSQGSVHLWDLANFQATMSIKIGQEPVAKIAFSAHKQLLVCLKNQQAVVLNLKW